MTSILPILNYGLFGIYSSTFVYVYPSSTSSEDSSKELKLNLGTNFLYTLTLNSYLVTSNDLLSFSLISNLYSYEASLLVSKDRENVLFPF